jgi:hypothetical protein
MACLRGLPTVPSPNLAARVVHDVKAVSATSCRYFYLYGARGNGDKKIAASRIYLHGKGGSGWLPGDGGCVCCHFVIRVLPPGASATTSPHTRLFRTVHGRRRKGTAATTSTRSPTHTPCHRDTGDHADTGNQDSRDHEDQRADHEPNQGDRAADHAERPPPDHAERGVRPRRPRRVSGCRERPATGRPSRPRK